MSENVQSVMLEILKSVQAGVAKLDVRLIDLEKRMDTRFDALEETLRKQRRDTAGMLVMMKGVTGFSKDRVTGLERRTTAIENSGKTG